MFRKNLLLTTAFVVAAALSFLAPPAALARHATVGVGSDSNDEFLQTYGGNSLCGDTHFTLSAYSKNYGSSSSESGWTHVAVPIIGRGKTVDSIVVRESAESEYASEFSAGIYSNTPSGTPGKLIAGAAAYARDQCRQVSISIRPTKLSRNTKYWIEETVSAQSDGRVTQMYWKADTRSKRQAYVQYHSYRWLHSSGGSYTSPWTLATGAPYLKLN
jgi:hypothetical protein